MGSKISEECRRTSQLPWTAGRGPAAARRVRLFDDAVLEHVIFRGHPAAPFVLFAPVVGLLFEHTPPVAPLVAVGHFALGLLVWTLLEYLAHRFVFHLPRRGPIRRITAFVLHGHHHVAPEEPSRLAATPVQAGASALVAGAAWALVLEPWTIALAGTLVGYVVYEAAHHLAHHERRPARGLRWITRHHLAHHFGSAEARFGISSPLWDWVFRTHR